MMQWRRRTAMTAFLIATVAGAASADMIYLVDGAILTGKLTRQTDGALKLQTDYAGELTVDAANVTGITTDEPMAVELTTGDAAVGRLVYDPQMRGQAIGVGGAAPRSVSTDAIRRIRPLATDMPPTAAMETAMKPAAGTWSVRAEAGFNGQTGNTDRANANGRIDLAFDTDRERLRIHARQRYGTERGKRSVNETVGGAKLEVDVKDCWFAYSGVEMEYDEFEDLDLRTTTTGGAGCFLIRQDDQKLKVRTGGGFTHEAFGDGTSTDDAVLDGGIEYVKRFNDRFSFTHETSYYPTLSNVKDFRLVLENAGEMALNKTRTVSLRAGVRNNYDSRPLPHIDPMDVFYFLNMGFKLK